MGWRHLSSRHEKCEFNFAAELVFTRVGTALSGMASLLRKFVSEARVALLGALKRRSRVTVVMGNQASDLDSMVASVVLACALQTESKCEAATVSPLINIPRSQFALRGEAPGVFADAGVDVDSLVFRDEVDVMALGREGLLDLVLVDHNRLADTQAELAGYVKMVVDHHADEKKAFPRCTYRRIERVGSACSLISLEVARRAPEILTPDVATFLTAAIIIDTANMDKAYGKGTATDTAALERLAKAGGVGPQLRPKLYEKLIAARSDVSSLTSAQLLLKDLKYGRAGGRRFAISAVPLDLKSWRARDPDLLIELSDFARTEGLALCAIMTVYKDAKTGAFSRQLLLFSRDKEMMAWMRTEAGKGGVEGKSAELDLKPISEALAKMKRPKGAVFVAYQQQNVKPSRKQVMPLITKLLDAYPRSEL